jgi:hypothetical protein
MECTFFTSGPRLEGKGGDGFFWDVVCSPMTDRGEDFFFFFFFLTSQKGILLKSVGAPTVHKIYTRRTPS